MAAAGFCTHQTDPTTLGFEARNLYDAACRHYDNVRMIDPTQVTYYFVRGAARPRADYHSDDLTNLNTIIARGIRKHQTATATLMHTLHAAGVYILDPLVRFRPRKFSKLLSTLRYFNRGIGTTSYLAFTQPRSLDLLRDLNTSGGFPLLTKPIDGRKGRDVFVLPDLNTAQQHAEQFFASHDGDTPLFLQQFMDFTHEYRVMVLNGQPLGVVEKHRLPGAVTANAATGAHFQPVEAPHIVEFAISNVLPVGLMGIDIAVTAAGELHLIEANRAPLWQEFQTATGIDIADAVMRATRHSPPPPPPDLPLE